MGTLSFRYVFPLIRGLTRSECLPPFHKFDWHSLAEARSCVIWDSLILLHHLFGLERVLYDILCLLLIDLCAEEVSHLSHGNTLQACKTETLSCSAQISD